MATEIRVPTLGESVTEATIGKWFKKPGEAVKADEPIVELETDKVTVEVPAPSAGVIAEILVARTARPWRSARLLGSISKPERAPPPRRPPLAASGDPPPRPPAPADPGSRGRHRGGHAAGARRRPSLHRRRERRRAARRRLRQATASVHQGATCCAAIAARCRPRPPEAPGPVPVRAPSPADDAARARSA
jgi:2-oxoglutarate dehydrogenase E2 component (dihydrolipoamide succinyltransferase)